MKVILIRPALAQFTFNLKTRKLPETEWEMTMLSTLMLALCCSVEAFAPARMARPAAAVRAAPMRTAPVMQFGKKKLTPEEVRPRGSARVGHGSWRPPCPARQRCCGLLLRSGYSRHARATRRRSSRRWATGQESGCAPTVVTFMSRGHRRRSRSSGLAGSARSAQAPAAAS